MFKLFLNIMGGKELRLTILQLKPISSLLAVAMAKQNATTYFASALTSLYG